MTGARPPAARMVGIVESRMSSRRLPGKNLRPILERPMLARLLERLRRSRVLAEVIIATSDDPSDDPIEQLARREGVGCHRGSLEDVLSRVLGAARAARADAIVEITGDCPLVDPGIVDAAARRLQQGDVDYVANILNRLTFPIGLDVQVYRTDLLEETAGLTQDPYDRVNVTPYIYHHAERYRIVNLVAPPALHRPGYRLCVDHAEDLALVSAIYETLYPGNPAFSAADVVQFLDANPALLGGNSARPDAFECPQARGPVREEVLVLDG
jgi:spore coat polysaccharide biosynthesis protein SpsF